VEAIHSGIDVEMRSSLLQRFVVGELRVVVCTDVLARGIDTLNAEHVILAEFSSDAVSYVHRAGRTGRAGHSGRVTSLVTRASLELARLLAAAAETGSSVEGAFSRNRSLRRSVKKQAIKAAVSAVTASSCEAAPAGL
jgi:superfamily II DNA/RNA helicase